MGINASLSPAVQVFASTTTMSARGSKLGNQRLIVRKNVQSVIGPKPHRNQPVTGLLLHRHQMHVVETLWNMRRPCAPRLFIQNASSNLGLTQGHFKRTHPMPGWRHVYGMVEGPIEPRLRLVGSEMPSQQMSGCGTNQTCQGSLTMPALEGRTDVSREAGDFRFGPRLCEKSVVQFACRTSVSVSSIRKPIALATSVGRRQLRKQFCASLAHATFHTGWFAGTTLEICNSSHVIRIDISGRPSSLHNSTSPFTTGPTFSGVPE